MKKRFKILKSTRVGFNNIEKIYEGTLEGLNDMFAETFKFGRIYNDKIKTAYKTPKGIVGGLNKTAYEMRDYFTEYSLIN